MHKQASMYWKRQQTGPTLIFQKFITHSILNGLTSFLGSMKVYYVFYQMHLSNANKSILLSTKSVSWISTLFRTFEAQTDQFEQVFPDQKHSFFIIKHPNRPFPVKCSLLYIKKTEWYTCIYASKHHRVPTSLTIISGYYVVVVVRSSRLVLFDQIRLYLLGYKYNF